MKHLKRFEGHREAMKSQFENKHHNLTGEDLSTYNYVLGISENGEINEAFGGALMDRLKKIARNGVLTATVLTSLLNTPAFANEYKSMSSEEKKEIMNLVKADSAGVETNATEDGTLTINIGSSFKSGEYEISNANDSQLQAQLDKLQEFIKQSGELNFKVTITASESKVPNKDAKTGERLGVGELSKLRAKSAESLVKNYINSLGINAGVNVETKTQVGTQSWDGGNANDAKYTADQFVNIKIEATVCPMCNFQREFTGGAATSETDYVSYQKTFDVKDMVGAINTNLVSGSIPDRLVVTGIDKAGNKVVIGDSGYIADSQNSYKPWSLVPEYVAGLTSISIKSPKADAITGSQIQHVTVKTFDELVNLMLKPEYRNPAKYNPSTENQSEIKEGLKKLKAQFDSGTRTFVFYKAGKINIPFDLAKKYSKVDVKIYSPIGKTGYNLTLNCQGK